MEMTGEFAGDGARVSGRREAELLRRWPYWGSPYKSEQPTMNFFVAHPPSLDLQTAFACPRRGSKVSAEDQWEGLITPSKFSL